MPSFNKVILMGNLTRDPELRFTGQNTAVCNIGVAVNERWKNKQTDQWEDRVNFIDCEAWGRTAENINDFFTKGKSILIEGKLRLDQWEQDGQKRSKLKMVVDRFEFVGGRDEQGPASGRGDTVAKVNAVFNGGPHQAVGDGECPF